MNEPKKPSALLSEKEAASVYVREHAAFCRVADSVALMSEAQAHAAGQVAREQLARCVELVQAKREHYDTVFRHWRESPWDPLARKYVEVYVAKYEAASEILAALLGDESAGRVK